MLKKFSTILSAAEQDTTSRCQPVTFAGLRHGTVYVSVRTLSICEAFVVFVGTQAVNLGLPVYVVRSRLSFGRMSCARNQCLDRGHMVSISNASRRRPWNVDFKQAWESEHPRNIVAASRNNWDSSTQAEHSPEETVSGIPEYDRNGQREPGTGVSHAA